MKSLIYQNRIKNFRIFSKNKNKTISIDEISVNNWLYDEMPESTIIRTYIKI